MTELAEHSFLETQSSKYLTFEKKVDTQWGVLKKFIRRILSILQYSYSLRKIQNYLIRLSRLFQ